MKVVSAALVLFAMAPPCSGQGRPCKIMLISAQHNLVTNQVLPGNINYDIGGDVRLRCVDQPVFLDTDSVSIRSGQYIQLIGHAVYHDTSYRFTADSMVYHTPTEKLEARHNVHVLDLGSGSTLVGPYVDYWRAVRGINDSARVVAIERPTVHYFARGPLKDTLGRHPYVLTGDRLTGFGQSRLWGGGNVTIDRESIHGAGDSLAFERVKTSVGQLMGPKAVLHRTGPDSFTVHGHEIRLSLDQDKIRELRSFIDADVVRSGSRVAGDTIVLGFTDEKLGLTLAWAPATGATLHSAGYDARGDSLAVESPGEVLHEVRIFRHGVIVNPLDSVAARRPATPGDSVKPDTLRNTIWGERILAHFSQVDSAGTPVTHLSQLQSFGHAASLYSRVVIKNGKRSPSTNYTRADTIVMVMRAGDSTGVVSVHAFGHVDGLQQETASLRHPADTVKGQTKVVKP
ncbi:MAG TPA: hypothetical protein VGL65_09000 [Gemmatimonadales bacterium]|jgi:hypothetical protein